MFYEVGMVAEILVFAVFKDKHTIWFQEVLTEDERGDGGQLLQGIGRIGKDEVELHLTALDEPEGIAADWCNRGRTQFLQALHDEAVMVAVCFDADDLRTAA